MGGVLAGAIPNSFLSVQFRPVRRQLENLMHKCESKGSQVCNIQHKKVVIVMGSAICVVFGKTTFRSWH